MPGTWAGGPMRASAARNRRPRQAALKARLNATRRTQASGSSYSATWRQRTAARAKASWATSSASARFPVTPRSWTTSGR
jgi:hypothetical protein